MITMPTTPQPAFHSRFGRCVIESVQGGWATIALPSGSGYSFKNVHRRLLFLDESLTQHFGVSVENVSFTVPAPVRQFAADFQVHSNIPIPEEKRRGRPNPYPTFSLEIGQSFFYRKTATKKDKAFVASYLNYLNNRCKLTAGRKFRWGIHRGGVMIWRTA